MTHNDEQIKDDWAVLDSINIEQACNYLRNHEQDIQRYLINLVAALCDVDVRDMLGDNDIVYNAHARWLFWYAYRYMTSESYEKIAKDTAYNGRPFHLRTIQSGVNKMAMMIAQEDIWQRRWKIIKRIIKLRDKRDEEKTDNTIIIQVPRDLRNKINITIKEK
jgi:hypothetical protein